MPGEEIAFEFGVPEFAMLALVLFSIYTIFFFLSSLADRQRAHLADMERQARADAAGRDDTDEPTPDTPPSP